MGRSTVVNSGAITGRVTTQSGTPVEDASVVIVKSSVPCHDIAALTNKDGAYMFRGLQTGDYTLQVTVNGFHSQRKQTQVKRGQTASLNFSLN